MRTRPSLSEYLGRAHAAALTVIVLLAGQISVAAEPPASAKPKGQLRVVVLEGSPYNRGLVYGKTLKDDIQHLMKGWNENLRQTYKMDADTFVKKFYAKTDYV